MKIRKVFFAKIDVQGSHEFADILLSTELNKFLTKYGTKDLEVSHVKDNGNHITGMFVATQHTDIPPVHEPGKDDDYSAVELEDGKGFAYPNVFLYDKSNKVLCYEVNKYGFSEKVMDYFFNTFSAIKHNNEFKFDMGLVLNIDPIQRTKGLTRINEVEIQIANPLTFIESDIAKNGSFKQFAELSKEANATKSITVSVSASDDKTERLSKKAIIAYIKSFMKLPHTSTSRTKDRMRIKGEVLNEDDEVVTDIINVMMNTLEGSFKLTRKKLADGLQIDERVSGIETVYNNFKSDIESLI